MQVTHRRARVLVATDSHSPCFIDDCSSHTRALVAAHTLLIYFPPPTADRRADSRLRARGVARAALHDAAARRVSPSRASRTANTHPSLSSHMFAIATRAPSTSTRRVVGAKTRVKPTRSVVRCAARARGDGGVGACDRRKALGAMLALALAANPTQRARAADDDASFSSKLSAKEAQKAKILADARAKAQAQAAPAPSAAKAPTSAAMFMTDDPGRGGGPDAPNVAVKADGE